MNHFPDLRADFGASPRIRGYRLPAALAPVPSHAAAKIQHLISPGGIEAWFVQDATVPLIAMEYAFGGGATQDPADKPGVGNMVASLLDEGAEDLDSKTFHERLDRRAIELSFTLDAGLFPRLACACSRTTGTKPSTCCGWR